MKLIAIILFVLNSFNSIWAQIGENVNTFTYEKVQDKKEKLQYEQILEHRIKCGTNKRMDSIDFKELVLIENAFTRDSIFYVEVIEIYIRQFDTIAFNNGHQNNFYGKAFYLEKQQINLIFEYKKVNKRYFNVVTTTGCIRMRRNQAKEQIRRKYEDTYTIKTKISNQTVQNLILIYPIKKARFIVFRNHDGRGYNYR